MDKIVQVYCNNCVGLRRHNELFSASRVAFSGDEDHESVTEQIALAACCGCDTRTTVVRTFYGDEQDMTQYPSQITRKAPDWLWDIFLEDNINNPVKHDFITEIYVALGAGALRLATLGIRALIEHVMIEKIGADNRTFVQNLDAFEEKGYLSKYQRLAIEPVLEAGHASMHRGFKAAREDVLHLLDVTENLIQLIYIYQPRSEKMKIPPRPAKVTRALKGPPI